MLATISNIIAAETMLWGESQSDMPATMNADRPKPEKPRTNPANSATPIAYRTTGSGPGNSDAMIIRSRHVQQFQTLHFSRSAFGQIVDQAQDLGCLVRAELAEAVGPQRFVCTLA